MTTTNEYFVPKGELARTRQVVEQVQALPSEARRAILSRELRLLSNISQEMRFYLPVEALVERVAMGRLWDQVRVPEPDESQTTETRNDLTTLAEEVTRLEVLGEVFRRLALLSGDQPLLPASAVAEQCELLARRLGRLVSDPEPVPSPRGHRMTTGR